MFIVMLKLIVKYDDFEPIFPKKIFGGFLLPFFGSPSGENLPNKTLVQLIHSKVNIRIYLNVNKVLRIHYEHT